MSPEAGGYRLVLVDLAGGDAAARPLAALAEAIGSAPPEPHVVRDRAGLERLLETERTGGGGALILTFGRIGCGREGWAPEAVLAHASSGLPAMATALRLLWTERHPDAYLFRNAVAVVGSSLVVNLPSDPAMVSEAAAFLARVARHALEKIAGGDEECAR